MMLHDVRVRRIKALSFRIACTLLLLLGGASVVRSEPTPAPASGTTQSPTPYAFPELLSTRKHLLPEDLVLKQMKLRPSMEIVDVGAGAGLFTFPFAYALEGTGHVYAVDVVKAKVDSINEIAAQQKLKNVSAVLVRQAPLDEFFKVHQFDVMFVSDMLSAIPDIQRFFSELRPSLKMAGDLYVIDYRQTENLYKWEFDNLKTIVSTLRRKPENFPVMLRLDEQTRNYVRNWRGEEIPDSVGDRLLENFNKMLHERGLIIAFMNYAVEERTRLPQADPGSPQSIYLWSIEFMKLIPQSLQLHLKWLFVQLDDAGAFDPEEPPLGPTEQRMLNELNKWLIFTATGADRKSGINSSPLVLMRSERSVKKKIEAAGFVQVEEYDLFPFYYFLKYKRKH